MINYFEINNYALVLIDIIGIWLAFWVYFANQKEKENKGFFLMVATILLWINFYHFAVLSTENALSVMFFRLAACSVFLFFIAYYFFVIKWFLNKKGFHEFLGRIIFLYGFIFSLISIFTDFIIKNSQIEKWATFPIFSLPGWFIFYGYVILLTVFINTTLLVNYFKSPSARKRKIQYFLIGMFVFAGLNFIFNVMLPVFLDDYRFYQLGNYSAFFLLGFTAYAVVKQKLFNAKVVLAAIFVGLFIVLYILDIVIFTPQLILQTLILKGGILIAFLSFGILLIRSVLLEIRAREKIEDLATKLEFANARLKQLDEAKSDFLSMASHQLRTPLTAIKGYASMILEGDFGEISETTKGAVNKIFQSSNRLALIISDFLDLSHIEQGTMQYDFTTVDAKALVKGLVEEFRAVIDNSAEKSKVLKISFEANEKENFSVFADHNKINQVLSNLIDNSIKYTPKGFVKITLSKNNESGNVLIKIEDSGIGITKETMPNLFKKFGRSKSLHSIYAGGSGLGLYVAKEIINAHNGKVWAESEGEGKGSEFFVELAGKTM